VAGGIVTECKRCERLRAILTSKDYECSECAANRHAMMEETFEKRLQRTRTGLAFAFAFFIVVITAISLTR
jgi:hypothetical protein